MRVVVDANVWISGLISPAGSPAKVVQAVLDGQIIPVFSKATFAELRSVLARPKISRYLARSSMDVNSFLGNLKRLRNSSRLHDEFPPFVTSIDRITRASPSRFAALIRGGGT